MTNRAQRRPLWHGVGRFLFFLTGSALLLLMVLFFGQSWWGALALTSAVIFVWAIVLIRSEWGALSDGLMFVDRATGHRLLPARMRSEEHTSELQSLMRISYAVFCFEK